LAAQECQQIDTQVVDDVRNFLFGPPGAGGFDLASLNIQRGREHGIPSYNAIRRALGYGASDDFSEYRSVERGLGKKLADVYNGMEEVDAWVGMLGEKHVRGAMVGETLLAVLSDQFTRTRDGDRFWYQNHLSRKMQRFIEKQTLARIIMRNTEIKKIPANVFRVKPGKGSRIHFHTTSCIHPELEHCFRQWKRSSSSIESLLDQLDE
jgi:hypothetical protein